MINSYLEYINEGSYNTRGEINLFKDIRDKTYIWHLSTSRNRKPGYDMRGLIFKFKDIKDLKKINKPIRVFKYFSFKSDFDRKKLEPLDRYYCSVTNNATNTLITMKINGQDKDTYFPYSSIFEFKSQLRLKDIFSMGLASSEGTLTRIGN